MRNTNICGLDRNAMTEAGVVRARVSLDDLRRDAKASGLAQVIARASEPSRVLVVFPGGGIVGTGVTPMGWSDAEELAAWYGDGKYTVRAGEVMG